MSHLCTASGVTGNVRVERAASLSQLATCQLNTTLNKATESGFRRVMKPALAAGKPLQKLSALPDVYVRDPCKDPDWDARWRSLPGWSVFHTSSWGGLLGGCYGFRPCYIELESEGRPCGLLPLMEANSFMLGRRGVSLPFSDTCPMLSADSAHAGALLRNVLDLARQRQWRYLELRGSVLSDNDAKASVRYCEHSLEFPADEGVLFSRFKPELRTAIRKSEKSGFEVQIGTGLSLVREFYQLHSRTRKRQGVPPQPFKFFRGLQERVLENGKGMVVIARRRGKGVAGAVFLHTDSSAIFKFGASDPAFLQLRPNNLVMWEAMRWYVRRGTASLHMGRTSLSNQGLRRFKLAWATTERELCYHRLDPKDGSLLPAADRSESRVHRLFQRLPEPVLRLIGALLYRQMD